MNQDFAALRRDYTQASLEISNTLPDPISQFKKWFSEAQQAGALEPNAMTLSTISAEGRPDARIVLIKDVQEDGFTFFTNYTSRKGKDLDKHPFAALTFYWSELERQVRIEGDVEKVDAASSDAYFGSRPRGSQIGAWTSPQSQEIPNRGILETRQRDFEERFAQAEVPRPEHWGGYLVKPLRIEFWQGRASRLHDRIVYEKSATGGWERKRLAP
ncbi:pyridoxamine 5'-phosphate oxidase [Cesiribacter andamanensis]|uniref:Pyridoxine/pyridoxamine 5'-phosphate oxidase n=1 Tax=Cesiribacter andamanensis AMV16 TaxID=1279009 RepID=M7P1I9_9BACT|nr:pyridoxamine 5'-phosphate oxidase [Cesiribacter andamanensis]EMR04479.1 Pyridoxine/pyridoxamine 5'-phosphate oxidase [Cesiribacter andamanensis AMV16]